MFDPQGSDYAGLEKLSKAVVIDAKMLESLRKSQSSDTNKVINLIKNIETTVEEKGSVAPYLISIGERAEVIREQFDERHISSEQARQQLDLLAEESIAAEKAKKDSGLDDLTFTVFWELKRHTYKNPKKLAVALAEQFKRFPNFNSNAEQMRQLKAELYRVLVPVVQGKPMVEIADRLINALTP